MCKTWTYARFSENPPGRPDRGGKKDVSGKTRTYGNRNVLGLRENDDIGCVRPHGLGLIAGRPPRKAGLQVL